jgi:hypothetical protein
MKILQLFSYKTLLFLVDTRTSSRETQTKENSKEINEDIKINSNNSTIKGENFMKIG